MTRVQMILVGFGIAFVFGGIYAIAVGKLKWDEQHNLEGFAARAAGVGTAIVGAGLAYVGWFVLD